MALNRAMLELPFIAEFVEQNNLGYIDTMVEVVETIFAECKIPTGTRPVMALCDWPASYETLEAAAAQERRGVRRSSASRRCPATSARCGCEDDSIWLGDQQIDVIYRMFLMEDLLDPAGPALIEPVLRAAERGKVAIFSPMDAELYSSKGALALLSDEANRHLFTAGGAGQHGPDACPGPGWCGPGPVTVEAAGQVLLEDYAIAERRS